MSLTLYHGEPNGPSLTVLAALFAKQLPADLRYLDLARGERHGLACAHEPLVAMSIEGEGRWRSNERLGVHRLLSR
jgi:GST-like protein